SASRHSLSESFSRASVRGSVRCSAPRTALGPGGRLEQLGQRFDNQKSYRSANCIRRGSPDVKILPKNGPKSGYGPGMPQLGWLNVLKLSARNWIEWPSRTRKRRCRPKSKRLLPGPGMVSRPALPKVKGAGAEKAEVLKKCSDVRS